MLFLKNALYLNDVDRRSCIATNHTLDLPTPTTPLAIASQNVAFTSVGGTGSVVVGNPEDTLTTVRAVTDADWATVSVSGNTITVEAKSE